MKSVSLENTQRLPKLEGSKPSSSAGTPPGVRRVDGTPLEQVDQFSADGQRPTAPNAQLEGARRHEPIRQADVFPVDAEMKTLPGRGDVSLAELATFAAAPTLDGLRTLLAGWFAPFSGKTSLEVRGTVDASAEVQPLQLHYSAPNHSFHVGDRRSSAVFAPTSHHAGDMKIRETWLGRDSRGFVLTVGLKVGTVGEWTADKLGLDGAPDALDPVYQTAAFRLETLGNRVFLRGVDFKSSLLPGIAERSASVELPTRLIERNDVKGSFFQSAFD